MALLLHLGSSTAALSSIILPSHPGCKIGRSDIILTFHTHPNTGPNYIQEPSQTDIRAVRDDADLKGAYYLGELVISKETLYLIEEDSDDATIKEVLQGQ